MLVDCHLHSTFSSDAKSPIMEMCRSAVRKGVSIVCFTEHVDMNPADSNYGFYHHANFTAEIESAKSLFDGKLEILQGIEFAEPHLYPRDFETMTRRQFDFVLGSVHAFQGTWAGAEDILQKYSADEIYDLHYSDTLKMVGFGGFDALAHMDLPRRYIPESREPAALIDSVLSALIRSGIALELNSSPLRRGLDFSLPSPFILRRYKELGGISVTLGSDAHHAEDVCSGMDHLLAQAESQRLNHVYFRGRTPFPAA